MCFLKVVSDDTLTDHVHNTICNATQIYASEERILCYKIDWYNCLHLKNGFFNTRPEI
jgi:hypothetical protein